MKDEEENMTRKDVVFRCADRMTPDIAARLATLADRCQASLRMECMGRSVLLDSLIGILSEGFERGMRLSVIADGPDEREAVEAVCATLEGR